MLNTDNIFSLSNDELYSLYLEALECKSLPVINTIRSIISSRYCISELKKSPLDNPFRNPDISRFFSLK